MVQKADWRFHNQTIIEIDTDEIDYFHGSFKRGDTSIGEPPENPEGNAS
jgi:hypothetical protein